MFFRLGDINSEINELIGSRKWGLLSFSLIMIEMGWCEDLILISASDAHKIEYQ